MFLNKSELSVASTRKLSPTNEYSVWKQIILLIKQYNYYLLRYGRAVCSNQCHTPKMRAAQMILIVCPQGSMWQKNCSLKWNPHFWMCLALPACFLCVMISNTWSQCHIIMVLFTCKWCALWPNLALIISFFFICMSNLSSKKTCKGRSSPHSAPLFTPGLVGSDLNRRVKRGSVSC